VRLFLQLRDKAPKVFAVNLLPYFKYKTKKKKVKGFLDYEV